MPSLKWPFAKYVACGNDFILFDDRMGEFSYHSELISFLCHRQFGIGSDGVILLQKDSQATLFRMRIFNADGSEAEMCGNGLRCLVKFLEHLGHPQRTYTIRTMHADLNVSLCEKNISIEMGSPLDYRWSLSIPFQKKKYEWHYMEMGVPHAIHFTNNLEFLDVEAWGAAIRSHPIFEPRGTNANFVERVDEKKFRIRTFERGVEKETLACGTGSTAAALAAAYCYDLSGPIKMETLSGEDLIINFKLENQIFSAVTLIGPANLVYKGEIELDFSIASSKKMR